MSKWYTGKMIESTEDLQRALYTDWVETDSEMGKTCKFCGEAIADAGKELHTRDCPRLAYLARYYDVTILPVDGKAVVPGSEFCRSGVHGWWLDFGQLEELLAKALWKEWKEVEEPKGSIVLHQVFQLVFAALSSLDGIEEEKRDEFVEHARKHLCEAVALVYSDENESLRAGW